MVHKSDIFFFLKQKTTAVWQNSYMKKIQDSMSFEFVVTPVSYSTRDDFYNENIKTEETVKR